MGVAPIGQRVHHRLDRPAPAANPPERDGTGRHREHGLTGRRERGTESRLGDVGGHERDAVRGRADRGEPRAFSA